MPHRHLTFALGLLLAFAALQAFCAPQAEEIDDSDWVAGPENWYVNWDKALAKARKGGKDLFILNTGSDWCHWCKKLKQEVLDTPEFAKFARKELVLVYLDMPNSFQLPKAQQEHNKLIAETLHFSGGVPHVMVFDTRGTKLGDLGGGGMTCEQYLKQLRRVLKAKGQKLKEKEVKALFKGYSNLLALQGKTADGKPTGNMPSASQQDFQAVVTGIALMDAYAKRDEAHYEKLKFRPPETSITVPFGKYAVFRVKYKIPKGYETTIWTRPDFPSEYDYRGQYFGSNPSGFYKGKGTAYGFFGLLENGKTVTVESLIVLTETKPQLPDVSKNWTISHTDVNITFLAKPE